MAEPKCKQCGDCCHKYFHFEGKSKARAAFELWRRLDIPFPLDMDENSEVSVRVEIRNAPCKHWNPLSKLCMDYLGRPEMCKKHFCEKAKSIEKVADSE